MTIPVRVGRSSTYFFVTEIILSEFLFSVWRIIYINFRNKVDKNVYVYETGIKVNNYSGEFEWKLDLELKLW